MKAAASVTIHPSQFPGQVRHDLMVSLRTRRVNHKFHYDSVKQTQKWLALHQVYSPSRNDEECAAAYDHAFRVATGRIKTRQIHLIGLGCGGGQKDTRLLKLLKSAGKSCLYTPCDVSTAMTLVAREAALTVLPAGNCSPFVCDLASAADLHESLGVRGSSLITFFGMIPNFEPQMILPKLAAVLRPKNFLLFSANLSPGDNYSAGLKRILPQYDNPRTHDWLMTFLLDLGVERRDGKLRFAIETGGFGLKRVVAKFHFRRNCRVMVEADAFEFRRGENIRLFFSYRYTPGLVRKHLARHGLKVCDAWIVPSGEEGVFLCSKR